VTCVAPKHRGHDRGACDAFSADRGRRSRATGRPDVRSDRRSTERRLQGTCPPPPLTPTASNDRASRRRPSSPGVRQHAERSRSTESRVETAPICSSPRPTLPCHTQGTGGADGRPHHANKRRSCTSVSQGIAVAPDIASRFPAQPEAGAAMTETGISSACESSVRIARRPSCIPRVHLVVHRDVYGAAVRPRRGRSHEPWSTTQHVAAVLRRAEEPRGPHLALRCAVCIVTHAHGRQPTARAVYVDEHQRAREEFDLICESESTRRQPTRYEPL
jgi:hypothetical protein